MNNKIWIYLDDLRTPVDEAKRWKVVRNYNEFIETVNFVGLDMVELISLDHDLGPSAMAEYFKNVSPNYSLDYNNIHEKTGYDCAKWLVQKSMETGIRLPQVYVHSANPIGSANIMGYINNYLMNLGVPQTCIRVSINHTVSD